MKQQSDEGRTVLADDGQVADDPLELAGGHGHGALVVLLGDAQVLGLDVHQLQLEVGDPVLICTREQSK